MTTRINAYPIVENAINLFGGWLKHRQEMRELRDMNSGDFARIARDLCVSPAELDAVVRRGPHASDELPRLLKVLDIDEATSFRSLQPSRSSGSMWGCQSSSPHHVSPASCCAQLTSSRKGAKQGEQA
jgi:uncharacterized protein YjiS (DUF1127 family)